MTGFTTCHLYRLGLEVAARLPCRRRNGGQILEVEITTTSETEVAHCVDVMSDRANRSVSTFRNADHAPGTHKPGCL